jgi:hypothetical protein
MSVYDAVTERIKELPPNTLSHGSILSFPDRGPWGNSQYRGNCSGYVYKRTFEHLRPRVFADPMVGSGTSVEVARDFWISDASWGEYCTASVALPTTPARPFAPGGPCSPTSSAHEEDE